jgi:predicted DNA-binding transcriptional regulator AlpA
MPESLEILRMVERGYLRVGDVAELLGVSRQRADQLRHGADFPTPIEVSGRRLWRRSDVERWAKRSWWGTKPWRVPAG